MRERTKGISYVLASAVFFALSTVGAKYATQSGEASAAHVTMARFIIGLLILIPIIIRNPTVLKARSPLWVGLRAVVNLAAVFLFFFGIQLTSVSKANLLNMTYPVFVFAIAPFVTGEKPKPIGILLLAITLFGAWNVIRPPGANPFSNLASGDLLAFGSAIAAGFAISVLRRARATDSSHTIIFYVMAVGAVANIGLVVALPLPPSRLILISLVSGLFGTLGQYALTIGFAHVSAPTGALLSTSRILMALILGIVLFGDIITTRTILGALLIVASLVAASLADRRISKKSTEGE